MLISEAMDLLDKSMIKLAGSITEKGVPANAETDSISVMADKVLQIKQATKDTVFIINHIVASDHPDQGPAKGTPISGGFARVDDRNGNMVARVPLDAKGIGRSDPLPPAFYSITMENETEGFAKSNVFMVWVDGSNPEIRATIESTPDPAYKWGKIQVNIHGAFYMPLYADGAVIEVYDSYSNLVDTIVSKGILGYGTAMSSYLLHGTYTVKLVKDPPGGDSTYVPDSAKIRSVTIDGTSETVSTRLISVRQVPLIIHPVYADDIPQWGVKAGDPIPSDDTVDVKVSNVDGNLIDIVPYVNGHMYGSKLLSNSTYTLTVIDAPVGTLIPDPVTITVDNWEPSGEVTIQFHVDPAAGISERGAN